MKPRWLLFLSFLLASSGLLGGAPTFAQPSVPRFEPAPCPFTLGQGLTEGTDVRCGYLVVPEDHAHPDGRDIRLAIAIYKSPSATPSPDPLIDLEGGPGAAATSAWGPSITRSTAARYLGDHDLILLDQRGVGHSTPSLACPELTNSLGQALRRSPSPSQAQARATTAVRKCHDRLIQAGVDLNAYTTLQSAADVADLRTALGYQFVDLYGGSYGTRLALTVMRAFPAGIRSVVLDAVDPPQGNIFTDTPRTEQQAFDTLFSTCAHSPACNTAYPHLKQVFTRLVTRLSAKPVLVTVTSPGAQRTQRLSLDGAVITASLYLCLFVTPCIPSAPAVIYQTWDGNYALVKELNTVGGSIVGSLSWGMYLSVECGEDLAYTTPQKIAAAAQGLPRPVRASVVNPLVQRFSWCKTWHVKRVDAAQKQQVTSDIPTLILEGAFDPVTPPSNGALAARTLSHGYLEVFPATGHGSRFSNACADSIVWAFLHDPTHQPDGSCLATITGPWS